MYDRELKIKNPSYIKQDGQNDIKFAIKDIFHLSFHPTPRRIETDISDRQVY